MDPCKGMTADGLALRYTQEYNKVYSGKSDPLPGGGLVTVRLLYDAGSLCPILSLCYDDKESPRKYYFQMNWMVGRDGSLRRIPEMLDTLPFEDIPGKADIPELANAEKNYWRAIEDLKNTVLNWKLIALLWRCKYPFCWFSMMGARFAAGSHSCFPFPSGCSCRPGREGKHAFVHSENINNHETYKNSSHLTHQRLRQGVPSA